MSTPPPVVNRSSAERGNHHRQPRLRHFEWRPVSGVDALNVYWYWWVWVAIVVFLILLPLGYGSGYRRWGAPYPSYYYRRRTTGSRRAVPTPPPAERRPGMIPDEPPFETVPAPWGVLGDLFWLAVLGAIVWAIVAYWG